MGWKKAFKYIDCLNDARYLGHRDWRIPNRKELRTLVDYGRANNADWLAAMGMMEVKKNYYWSSTTYPGDLNQAWAMKMKKGNMVLKKKPGKSTKAFVWPVRGGVLLP